MTDFELNTKELKELSFSSVLSHLGASWERKGNRLVTKCLWHEDKRPSLYLNEKGHYCHCFVCGRSWSTIDYVMQYRGEQFKDACEWMRREFNLNFNPNPNLNLNPNFLERKNVKTQKRKNVKKRTGDYLRDFAIRERNTTLRAYQKDDGWIAFNPEYVEEHVSMENCFSKCLLHYFDREVVEAVTRTYCLGCYHFKSDYLEYRDDVMFPSVDRDMVVHNIKLQHYDTDPTSPQFFHCNKKHILWLGKVLQDRGEMPNEAVFDNSPLFGEHLLGLLPEATVALVESPKNALIGACAFPQYLWIAAGNKNNLSRSNLEVLRERKVIVLPDCDAVEDWKDKLCGMSSIANFRFSSLIDLIGEECGEKGDIGDLILKKCV